MIIWSTVNLFLRLYDPAGLSGANLQLSKGPDQVHVKTNIYSISLYDISMQLSISVNNLTFTYCTPFITEVTFKYSVKAMKIKQSFSV